MIIVGFVLKMSLKLVESGFSTAFEQYLLGLLDPILTFAIEFTSKSFSDESNWNFSFVVSVYECNQLE